MAPLKQTSLFDAFKNHSVSTTGPQKRRSPAPSPPRITKKAKRSQEVKDPSNDIQTFTSEEDEEYFTAEEGDWERPEQVFEGEYLLGPEDQLIDHPGDSYPLAGTMNVFFLGSSWILRMHAGYDATSQPNRYTWSNYATLKVK